MNFEDHERIFMEIYAECENDDTNNVQVSALLSYIGPYIDSNSHYFEELKQTLDPANVNPSIDKETFKSAMMSWADKFKNEVDFNFNNEEISRQSTPTKNLTVDYAELNLSSVSGYSLNGSVFSSVDANVLQEQNNELQHQNKKLCECLDDMKYQLTAFEEQNVSLLNEIESINKTNQAEQKLIKSLQTKCAEYEKEREEHTKVSNENKLNCETLVTLKRANVELENRLKELETKNKAYTETIEKLSDLSNEKDKEEENLRKYIKERDAEVLQIQEREAEWRQKCAQHELNIKNFISETNDLKNHIQSLEAMIEKQNESHQNNIFEVDNFEPGAADGSPSPSSSDTQHKSTSLSPEEQQSPHESLHSELAQVSTLDCFNSCGHRINQLEDDIAKLYEELMVQGEQLKVAQGEKEAADQESSALTTELNQLKTNLEAALKETLQLNNKVSYYKVTNKNFKVQLEAKLVEVVSMRKKLANRTNIEQKLSNENKDLAEKLTTVNLEVNELKENNCKLMNEISSLERAVKLERKRNTRVDLNSKINSLEEQLEQAKCKNQQLTSTISALTQDKQLLISKLEVTECNEYGKRKVESLEAKLHKYRRTIIDLENEIQTLSGHVESAKETLLSAHMLLKLSTNETSNIWKDYFMSLNVHFHDDDDIDCDDDDVIVDKDELLQHEIQVLDNQIRVTTMLLNTFSKIKNKMRVTSEKVTNEKERKWTFNRNSNKIDVKTLCNPHERNIKVNREFFLSLLSPKKSPLKPPSLIAKSKEKTHFVFPPMSPECSASTSATHTGSLVLPQMPDAETQETSEILPIKNNDDHEPQVQVQTELNNNVSGALPSVPVPVLVPVPVPEIPINTSNIVITAKTSEADEQNQQRISVASGNSGNSTFTKTYSDSFIEKIFIEQKIGDIIPQIEETRIFGDKDESDASESVSSMEGDDDHVKLKRNEEQVMKERLARQVRSLSEGTTAIHQLTKDGEIMVFPNLQDDALKALGLLPNDESTKERLTEAEMEVKFQTLALVFSIDAVTVGARMQRLRRQRDQAEDNFGAEIARLTAAVHRLHPLCVDAETTELVTSLLDRLQFIVQASHRIFTSAEMYGSVQEEWRIAESVNLMLNHLRNVIKQRDAAQRQLKITKRILEETTSPSSVLKKPGVGTTTTTTTRRLTINTLPLNGRVVVAPAPARRASIAVIPRPLDSPSAGALMTTTIAPLAGKRVAVRRTSEAVSVERPEPSCRPWDYRRAPLLSRPSRLDINPELRKIQEVSTESFTSTSTMNDSLDNYSDCSSGNSSGDEFQMEMATATSTSTVTGMSTTTSTGTSTTRLQHPLIVDEYKRHVKRVCRHYVKCLERMVMGQVQRWAADGTLHEICVIGATVCFGLAILFLCNTVIEIELARDGRPPNRIPWNYVTWNELFSFFFTKK